MFIISVLIPTSIVSSVLVLILLTCRFERDFVAEMVQEQQGAGGRPLDRSRSVQDLLDRGRSGQGGSYRRKEDNLDRSRSVEDLLDSGRGVEEGRSVGDLLNRGRSVADLLERRKSVEESRRLKEELDPLAR